MPNLNRLRYEPYILHAPQVAASLLRNATVASSIGGGGGGGSIYTGVQLLTVSGLFNQIDQNPLGYGALTAVGAATMGPNVIQAVPFALYEEAVPLRASFYENTAAVSPAGDLTISIWDNTTTVTSSAWPGRRLAEFIFKDLSTGGLQQRYSTCATSAPTLPPGNYWYVYHHNGNSVGIQNMHPSYHKPGMASIGGNPPMGFAVAPASGYSLPDVFPVTATVLTYNSLVFPTTSIRWSAP